MQTICLIDKLKPGIQIFNYSDEPQMTSSQIAETITNFNATKHAKNKNSFNSTLMLTSIFDFIGKLTGYNFPITATRIKKFAATNHHKANKIRKLGFKQKIEIREGFRRMVEWCLDTRT